MYNGGYRGGNFWYAEPTYFTYCGINCVEVKTLVEVGPVNSVHYPFENWLWNSV